MKNSQHNTPLVSILLPVYNTEKYVGEAVASALAQTEGRFELLISDNASTDRTREIIRSFADPRIQFFQQEKNLGMVRNWDFLLQKASGEFCCLLGADDRFDSGHLARKISLLEENPEVGLVHGAARVIDSNGVYVRTDVYGENAQGPISGYIGKMLEGNLLHIGSLVFRMSFVRSHALHFDDRYRLFPDWQLWAEILMLSGGCIYDVEPTSDYRVHGNSVTHGSIGKFGWTLESLILRRDLLKQYGRVMERSGVNVVEERRKCRKALLINSASQLKRRSVGNSIKAFKEAFTGF